VAEALVRILCSPDRVAMGAAGRRWVAQAWSWDASARQLTELLDLRADRRTGCADGLPASPAHH
jgi:phosphatidylinositol alpha-1,6-mannosyltransferase